MKVIEKNRFCCHNIQQNCEFSGLKIIILFLVKIIYKMIRFFISTYINIIFRQLAICMIFYDTSIFF